MARQAVTGMMDATKPGTRTESNVWQGTFIWYLTTRDPQKLLFIIE